MTDFATWLDAELGGAQLPTDHFSVSQVRMYLRCPAQYMFRYCEGLKVPPAGAMTLGKSCHSAFEANFRQKIDSHADLPLSDMQDVFATTFDHAIPETAFDEDEDPGVMKDEGAAIVALHHKLVAPTVQPVAVEEPFELPLAGANFIGFIDLVTDGGVRDHKIAKRAPSQGDVDKDIQLTAYSLGHKARFGSSPKGLGFDYFVRTKQPKYVPMDTQRDELSERRFTRTVERVADAIRRQVFYPREDGNFMCSEKSCGYWTACRTQF